MALQDEVDGARLIRMEDNARHLYERGDLREGVTLAEARDVLWTYSSPELYELLVLRRGLATGTLRPFRHTGPDRGPSAAAGLTLEKRTQHLTAAASIAIPQPSIAEC